MIIPKAKIKIPIPIVLNPVASIPVTNFLKNFAIIIPAAIAANADIKDAASIMTGKILVKSIMRA